MAGLAIVAELRVHGERSCPKTRGRDMERLFVGPLRELEPFVSVIGLLISFENGGKPGIESDRQRSRIEKFREIPFRFGQAPRVTQSFSRIDKVAQVVRDSSLISTRNEVTASPFGLES
jgi:hypothetical protein